MLQAILVEKRRQEAVHQFGEEEWEVGKDTLTENMKGPTTWTNVIVLLEFSCLILPGASVNETKLWNVVKIAIIRTQRKRDKRIEQTLIALFSCSTWVKSEDLEEQPYLEVCRDPPGQGHPGQLAAASNLALRGRWPPSTVFDGGVHGRRELKSQNYYSRMVRWLE